MSSLAKIFEDIKVQQACQAAEVAPNVIQGKIPPSEMARVTGLELAKKQAGPEIERLRAEYNKLIFSSSAIIFVTGDDDKAKAFAELAKEDEALVVESDELWRRLARQAEDIMGPGRILNASVCGQIVRSVAQVLAHFQFRNVSYPQVLMGFIDSVATTEGEVAQVVKATMKKSTDDPVNVWWVAQDVANRAFAQDFTNEPLPVVVVIKADDDVAGWQRDFLPSCVRVSVDVDAYDSPADALAAARTELGSKLAAKA